jgi:hypothetical protein
MSPGDDANTAINYRGNSEFKLITHVSFRPTPSIRLIRSYCFFGKHMSTISDCTQRRIDTACLRLGDDAHRLKLDVKSQKLHNPTILTTTYPCDKYQRDATLCFPASASLRI